MKNSNCQSTNETKVKEGDLLSLECTKCRKRLVYDGPEPYDENGALAHYFLCVDYNCNGKHVILDYSQLSDDDLGRMYSNLDDLANFSGHYEECDEKLRAMWAELEKRLNKNNKVEV